MSVCPLCNLLHTAAIRCPECGSETEDKGKVSDFYDDYSPYMEIDGLKLEDGFPADERDRQCPHIFYCHSCQQEVLFFINEWD
ncbi:hypothetical protein ACFFJY_16240 [Fictibacillus aquaticus]|uniref:Uncharacterized protein n=1 Tax=Fictibacillus aquaticus TaxID=2021314 RepID=A0A235F6K4_9BACL|nr:hypothetical protein [Fictibacillus aquaticus]OYD56859.1 hypothetical protein CGZ90_14995 [Fictibacillus aquaticus]